MRTVPTPSFLVLTLIEDCQTAKKAYDDQYRKMWAGGQYNGRYSKKASALYKELKRLEEQLLKEIYR